MCGVSSTSLQQLRNEVGPITCTLSSDDFEGGAARSLRKSQPAHYLPLYVRPELGTRLQELLALYGHCRGRHRSSGSPPHGVCSRLPRTAGEDRTFKKRMAWTFHLALVVRDRLLTSHLFYGSCRLGRSSSLSIQRAANHSSEFLQHVRFLQEHGASFQMKLQRGGFRSVRARIGDPRSQFQ
jgi:hypothetical protein